MAGRIKEALSLLMIKYLTRIEAARLSLQYTSITIHHSTSCSIRRTTRQYTTKRPKPISMNTLRPLPTTLLRTGLRLRTRSTATLLSACRRPQSCNLARTMATRSRALTRYQTPITPITSGRALHASAELGERVENSTALLERTKLREEKIEEENTDNTKPVGGKGSEGIHFKRKPSHLGSFNKVYDIEKKKS
jgi:hypothetical protein